jgi:hypothetical protein
VLRVQCPNCQRRYRTVLEACGRTAVCSACRQPFKIGDSRPPFEWKQTSLMEDSWIGVAPPEEKREIQHCIMCEAPLEPGVVRCMACGANQITGVVHRKRPEAEGSRLPFGLTLPLRSIGILATMCAIAALGYLAIAKITASVSEIGDDMTDRSVTHRVLKHLQEGGNEYTAVQMFAGNVKDENLNRFLRLVGSGDTAIRGAAILLVGAGRVSDIQPILALGKTDDDAMSQIIQIIGARRLVELSCSDSEPARRHAAEGLCHLWTLKQDEETLTVLSQKMTTAEKAQRCNVLCRAYPEATGTFQLTVGDTVAPFTATVDQIGRTFYMRLKGAEFHSLPGERRAFQFPVEQWCAATGSAVDPLAVAKLITGHVNLECASGVGWQGFIRLTAKQAPGGPLPGFLPLSVTVVGQSVDARIELERH